MAVWSEVSWKNLSEDHRLDAEHYRPEYLQQAQAMARLQYQPLEAVAHVSDGNHISIAEEFSDTGVRYLRGKDLSEFFISDNDPVHVPDHIYQSLSRSHMLPGDVLLGIVATIGTVSLVTDRHGKLTGNCKIGIIRPKNLESEYIATFLASSVGQREIQRRVRGSVQTGLILPDLKGIPVPVLPKSIRGEVSQIVREAYEMRVKGEHSYAEAESLLMQALHVGMLNLEPRLFYERRYRDVCKAVRFDAEYYQPAKWEVLDALQEMPGRAMREHCKSVRDLFYPQKITSAELIRNFDLTDALAPVLDDSVVVDHCWPNTSAQAFQPWMKCAVRIIKIHSSFGDYRQRELFEDAMRDEPWGSENRSPKVTEAIIRPGRRHHWGLLLRDSSELVDQLLNKLEIP